MGWSIGRNQVLHSEASAFMGIQQGSGVLLAMVYQGKVPVKCLSIAETIDDYITWLCLESM